MPHVRRKSGHGLPNTSMTDLRKLAAAADAAGLTSRYHRSSSSKQLAANSMSRRNTGAQASSKPSKHSSRETSKTWDDEDTTEEEDDDDDRYDMRESFPQFCMTCEKQFVTKDDRLLYCSDACQDYDQKHGATISTQNYNDTRDPGPMYSAYSPEPRDIIPRASPSRPLADTFSLPSTPAEPSPAAPTTSSAVAALRSLSLRDSSPPSMGIWPFSSRSAAPSPGTSFAPPSSTVYASTYDHGYFRAGAPNYYYGRGATMSAGLELLPPLRRPGSYSRPQSIELVAPLLGQ